MKSEEDHDNGKFAAGVILGALIGASLAILFAPKSGEETRKIIKKKAKEYFDKGKEMVENKKENAKEAVKQVIDKALD
jgi:gas vesicle protein